MSITCNSAIMVLRGRSLEHTHTHTYAHKTWGKLTVLSTLKQHQAKVEAAARTEADSGSQERHWPPAAHDLQFRLRIKL